MVADARVEPYPPPLFLSLEEENDTSRDKVPDVSSSEEKFQS
jgi:hypothetical protein